MNVPLLDLKPQYAAIRDEVRAAIDRVVETQHFILGPEVSALEEEIAAYCGAAHAIGVSSGTDALLVALMALDIGPGDEVVTTPFSFFATASVIARLGARPVFVDIDPATFNLDAAAAVAALGARTRAVIPVHLFGRCADMDALLAACADRRIPVIEDAAQAIGATDSHGRAAGSIAEIGCFSFFPTKNLGAFGEGGLVTARDADVAHRITLLRAHGMEPRYFHRWLGGNFRLDAIQAAVLRVKLRHLAAWTESRRENARRYRALFEAASVEEGQVILPEDVPGHVYNQFVIRVRDRDALRAHLAGCGIGTEVYYPVPLHLQEALAGLGYGPGDFPAAETAAGEVLALPIYPELGADAQQVVVDAVSAFYRRRPRTRAPSAAGAGG
jgi:dTDP-4-amino-4,6-dideoxygalactose transaminase